MSITTIKANANYHRTEMLEGKRHSVMSVVMLRTGVFSGSNGTFYYPTEELASHPHAWNGVPIVIDHPQDNGQGVSANSPAVFNTSKVGVVLNAFFESATNKLRAEAWINLERLQELNAELWRKVSSGQIVEVSTGLFSLAQKSPGIYNGRQYEGVIRNHIPDHLALLTTGLGACNHHVDGCGLNTNADAKGKVAMGNQQCTCHLHDNIELPPPRGLPSSLVPPSEMPGGRHGVIKMDEVVNHSSMAYYGGAGFPVNDESLDNFELPEPRGLPSSFVKM